MRAVPFSLALALALCACERQQPVNPADIEQVRQSEKAADQAKPLSENSLTRIVKEALQSESSLDARKIQVENREGVVALSGTVASEEQKDKAARIVGSVGGVKTVDNRLTVDESASTGSSVVPSADSAGLPPPGQSTPRRE
jgi:hyperosmotically inducible protein